MGESEVHGVFPLPSLRGKEIRSATECGSSPVPPTSYDKPPQTLNTQAFSTTPEIIQLLQGCTLDLECHLLPIQTHDRYNNPMKQKFKQLLDELDQLQLPPGKSATFGSGPMAIRGLKDTKDLDIIVTKGLFNNLQKKFPQDTSKHPCGCLVIGNIEISSNWLGHSSRVNEFIETAEMIQGYPFVKLEYVLERKSTSQRPKDQKHARAIKKFLKKQNKV